MSISTPYVRKSIKRSFADLYDLEFQKSWFDPNYPHAFSDSLDYYVFDFLMEDAHLYGDAHEQIGISLYNKEEADSMENCLDFFTDEFKARKPDSYYVNHPAWQRFTS